MVAHMTPQASNAGRGTQESQEGKTSAAGYPAGEIRPGLIGSALDTSFNVPDRRADIRAGQKDTPHVLAANEEVSTRTKVPASDKDSEVAPEKSSGFLRKGAELAVNVLSKAAHLLCIAGTVGPIAVGCYAATFLQGSAAILAAPVVVGAVIGIYALTSLKPIELPWHTFS